MNAQFLLTLTVSADSIDELDHVNNAVYLNYVELVARAHAESVGLSTERMIELGGVFVVRRHEVLYYRPAFAHDELTVQTRIEKVSGPRAFRQVQILRGEEMLVEAHTEWVWIDPTTRQPKRIPAEVNAALPPTIP